MKRIPSALFLIIALAVAMVGCARARYPRYYTLNLPSPADPPAPESVHDSIAVREFQSPAYLRQGPLVYRTTPEQIGFYEYHRWAADPRVLVTSAVMERLSASGKFSLVSAYTGRPDIDYVLSGNLEKLEEVDYDGSVRVEVALSAQITKGGANGTAVWRNSVSEVVPLSQRSVPGIVSQINQTMDLAIDKLLSTVPVSLASSK
jgi:ABC-type uncharacterized transport system auxiliary subunit